MIVFDNDYYIENSIEQTIRPKITVLGLGGAGGNALNTIANQNIKNLSCFALNTDIQALKNIKNAKTIQLGINTTAGMGTGANPEIGKISAEEDLEKIIECIGDSDIVFLIAGLGGGTGSGALPVIARVLQEKQILSIGIVTKPFSFEGLRRANVANAALQKVEEYLDTLIVIPNQKLFEKENSEEIKVKDAFEDVNNVIANSIRAVTDTINNTGHINVDFADIKTTMTRMGRALIGIGKSAGENRAVEAIDNALLSPLIENTSLKGARSVLINIQGDDSISLKELNTVASYIQEQVHPEAHIIIGSSIGNAFSQNKDELILTIIATGFEDQIKTRTANRYNNIYGYSSNVYTPPQNKYQNPYSQQNSFSNNNSSQQNQSFQNNYKENENNINPSVQNSGINNKQQNNLEIPTFLRKQNINNSQTN